MEDTGIEEVEEKTSSNDAEDTVDVSSLLEKDTSDLSDNEILAIEEHHQKTIIESEEDSGDQIQDSKTQETDSVVESPSKKKDEMTTEERIAYLEATLEKVQKKSDNRGNFIDQQNSVITGLKKKLDNLSNQKQDLDNKTTNQSYWDDPKQAIKAESEKQQVESKLEETSKELRYRENKLAIQNSIPEYSESVDDIIEYLKEIDPPREVEQNGVKVTIGTTQDVIDEYKKDPYVLPVQSAMQFANSAKLHKKSRLLEEKIGLMEKRPESIFEKVSKAANYETSTSFPSKTKRSIADISDRQLSRMSDEELKNYEKALIKSLERV